MKKTAMQLLIEQLEEQKDAIPIEAYQKGLEYAIQAAKLKLETEREQIEETYDEGYKDAEADMQQGKQTCGFCVETKEVEMIECPDCNGEGTWYNDTSRQCTTYRGDCCGGCGYDVDCDTCNGTGEIEKE